VKKCKSRPYYKFVGKEKQSYKYVRKCTKNGMFTANFPAINRDKSFFEYWVKRSNLDLMTIMRNAAAVMLALR